MDISVASPRFSRLNSSDSTVSNNCGEVAIDYSKSSSRMLPEGRAQTSGSSSSSSYRVPTKGMRKAYPEDQFASNHPAHSPAPPQRIPSSEYIRMEDGYQSPHHYTTNNDQCHTDNNSPHSSYYSTPPPPPLYNHQVEQQPHSRFRFNYSEVNQVNEEVKEYQCLKCGIIFSRESDLHLHYTQDHGYGQHNGGGGSSASSTSSAGGGNLSISLNNRNHQRNTNSASSSTSQEMFCDKCQLRFHCLLSFRVHQHEHVLPNVQPHYPMSNSHLLSLSYTCEICGANFMSRESLTDHANAHLYEHVCSESTCGDGSDGATTNSSEGFYTAHHYHHQQQQQGGYIEHHLNLDNSENHSSRHNNMSHHHQLQHPPPPHHSTHHQSQLPPHHFEGKADTENFVGNQGPIIHPYSQEYHTSSPYHPHHNQNHHQEITQTPLPPSSKMATTPTTSSGIYEPLIVMENGKRRFKCVICNKFLSSRIAHEEHTRGKHTGDKPYSCSFCGKRFAVWNTYKHHMSTHKGGITPLQKCGLCDKKVKTIDCLRTHMQREHNYPQGGGGGDGGEDGGVTGDVRDEGNSATKMPYVCQVCGKGFLRKMWRTRHYLSHAGQNCFRCELCSCILPDEQSYRMHHESHKVSN